MLPETKHSKSFNSTKCGYKSGFKLLVPHHKPSLNMHICLNHFNHLELVSFIAQTFIKVARIFVFNIYGQCYVFDFSSLCPFFGGSEKCGPDSLFPKSSLNEYLINPALFVYFVYRWNMHYSDYNMPYYLATKLRNENRRFSGLRLFF